MRTLHLISSLTGGGSERQLAYLTRELVRRGHDVHVGYSHTGPGRGGANAVAATHLPPRSPWSLRRVADVVALIRMIRPELVQTWSVAMDVIGGLAVAPLSIPWVVRESTWPTGWDRPKLETLRVCIARQFASGVVANSRSGLDYWRSRAPEMPVALLPNGVPPRWISAAAIPRRPVTEAIGMFVGRLDVVKNVDVIIAAAAQVIRDRDFRLTICGDGLERDNLKSLAVRLGIESHVHFMGHQHRVWGHLRRASFAVLVSDVEGVPNAALEAFAAGTPVVLSDIPAHRDLAPPGSVLFVNVDDVEGTARAMTEVLNDPEGATERATRARSALMAHSIEAAGDALENFYLEVLERRRPAPIASPPGWSA